MRRQLLTYGRRLPLPPSPGKVFTLGHMPHPKDKDREAYAFPCGGCTDTDFLRENEISVVYTQWGSKSPDLVEVRKNVYLLKEAGGK